MTTKKKNQDKLSLYQPLHKGINTENLDNDPIPEDKLLPVSPKTHKYIPIASILKYAKKGLSNQEVASIVGCSRENVNIRLRPYRQAINTLPDYQARELELIDLAKQGLLDELIKRIYSEDGIKKMAVPQLAMTFGILTDKAQAIKGKAPAAASNLSVSINFNPDMLPKSNGAKHLDAIGDSFTVDLDGKVEPAGGDTKD